MPYVPGPSVNIPNILFPVLDVLHPEFAACLRWTLSRLPLEVVLQRQHAKHHPTGMIFIPKALLKYCLICGCSTKLNGLLIVSLIVLFIFD